jgi:hypothetical protein
LRAEIPLFDAPKTGEPNDGKGDPANPNDPAGYPVVQKISITSDGLIARDIVVEHERSAVEDAP